MPSPSSSSSSWVRRAFDPVDIGGLAVFRVMFGLVMLVDFVRYWLAGWIDSQFLAPTLLFKYPGFAWVHPLPRAGMYALFGALIIASVLVAIGLFYRLVAWGLCLGHTYVFLLSASHYLNHAYLLSIVALLMAVVPAHRGLSVDAWRSGRGRGWTPAWAPWLMRVQLGIVYVYGGIAKINPDWLAGEPIRGWMRNRSHARPAWLGELLSSEPVVGLLVHGGLWFDLLVAPALWWRRTRGLAVLLSVGFHLSNAYLFNIGVFPWFMLLATTLFFEPDWPRRLPGVGARLDAALGPVPSPAEVEDVPPAARWRVLAPLAVWLTVQGLVPLRHHLYPGNVAWHEQGHYFSWRMKLRTKSGAARFVVTSPATGERWVVDPREELTSRQTRKMVGKPELVRQYAHHLAERWRRERGLEVEVRAQVNVSLNRRPRRPLIDSSVDLSALRPSLAPMEWVLPGPTEPVPRAR